eukprot:14308609-Ditylum_brightwellii.AAC.1
MKGTKVSRLLVIEDLLSNDVRLLPASIDPFMHEGLSLHWFRYGNCRKAYDMSNHDFGAAAGSNAGKRMSTYTLEDGDLCGIIWKADVTWRNKQLGDILFGEMCWDRNPSAWSS